MKKIISCMALTVLFFACKKTEMPVQTNPESTSTSSSAKGESIGPTVTTTTATIITSATATSGGSVSSSGGNNVTERGVCYNTSPDPTIANFKVTSGSGSGTFTSILSGLAGNTTYYVRAYAKKNTGTTYGNQVSFTTLLNYGTVTDADGNVYNTITINNQVWTLENLKTTKYRDGTPIPNVTGNNEWGSQITGAYCNYNNDAANVPTYGRLYNWYAVTDAHNIAPAGWHAPSNAEWQILVTYLGGSNLAGGKLKESGLAHWITPNTGATNSSGFTALPGGVRRASYSIIYSYFGDLGLTGSWWTSSEIRPADAPFIEMDNSSTRTYRMGFGPGIGYYYKRTGYSVRLVKD